MINFIKHKHLFSYHHDVKPFSNLLKIALTMIILLGSISHGFAQTTVTITSAKATTNYSFNATNNYGNQQVMWVEPDPDALCRSFVEFNLSSIPAGATISSATLRLVHSKAVDCVNETGGGVNFNVGIRRVTRTWVEGTTQCATQAGSLTWNSAGATNWTTAGGDFAATNYGSFTGGSANASGTLYNVNVLSLVNDWYNGTFSNFGLALVPLNNPTTNYEWFNIWSDDAPTATNRPQLIVTYTTCPVTATVGSTNISAACGTTTGTISITNPSGASSGNYEYQLNTGAWVTASTFTNLTEGTYTVSIRDANNTICSVNLGSVQIANINNDNDCDGVPDDVDLDDDNDGILDTVECPTFGNFVITPTNVIFTDSGQPGDVGDVAVHQNVATVGGIPVNLRVTVIANSDPSNLRIQLNNIGDRVALLNPTNAAGAASDLATIQLDFIDANTNTPITLGTQFTWRDIDGGGSDFESMRFATSAVSAYSVNTPTNIQVVNSGGFVTFSSTTGGVEADLNIAYNIEMLPASTFTTVLRSRSVASGYYFNSATFNNPVRTVLNPGALECRDTDGDNVPDYLDNDSDNDGCADAIEGGANFTASNIDANGRLTGGVGTNGVSTQAGAGQSIGASTVATQLTVTIPPTDQISAAPAGATFTIGVTASNNTSWTGPTSARVPVYGTPGNGNAQTLYQWYLGNPDNGGTILTNSGVYSGVTTATLAISNTTGLSGNEYYVVVSHSNNTCIRQVRSARLFCVKPGITVGGTQVNSNVWVSVMQQNGNGPDSRNNGHLVLESKTKGLVITRLATANLPTGAAAVKGMLVYDTTENCLKLYNGTTWGCLTPSCPD